MYLTIHGGCEKKVNQIKTIRRLTGLGLKEAKDAIDAPRFREEHKTVKIVWSDGIYCLEDLLHGLTEELEGCGFELSVTLIYTQKRRWPLSNIERVHPGCVIDNNGFNFFY